MFNPSFPAPLTRSALALTCLGALVVGGPATHAAPITFGQTNDDANSGSGDFGQAFVLDADSGYTADAYTLDTATFFRGSIAGGSSTLYLDVYENDGADESATFTGGGAPSGVTYLGSSTNFVNHDTANQGDALDFTFAGISLDPGTKYYLVFSSDAIEGALVGTSTRQIGVDNNAAAFNYVNIDDVDTAPLFGGNEAGDTGPASGTANEHRFTATVTEVPEPGSMALLGLGGLLVAARRRRG